MADAAAAPITPLSGAKKLPIEILTRAAGAAVKIGTGGIISEGDVKFGIDSLVDYIRRQERSPPSNYHTAVGRAVSNLFHKKFFVKMTKEIEVANQNYQTTPSEENLKKLEDIMSKYRQVLEAANKPPMSFRELCSRTVNPLRKLLTGRDKWPDKGLIAPEVAPEVEAEVEAAMCREEAVAPAAPGGAPPAPSAPPAPEVAEEDPEPPSGGKRRNKSRKARKGSRKARKGSREARKGSRKARKGLKSRKA